MQRGGVAADARGPATSGAGWSAGPPPGRRRSPGRSAREGTGPSQPPAHGASVVVSTRPASGPPRSRTITAVPPSDGTLPPHPLVGLSAGRTASGRRRLPSRLRRRANGGEARRPRPTRNRLSAPRPPAAAAPPIPPVPSSFTPAKGHRQSSRNGDVSRPTTAKPLVTCADTRTVWRAAQHLAQQTGATLAATSCSWTTGHAARTAPWAWARWRSSDRAAGTEGTVSQ